MKTKIELFINIILIIIPYITYVMGLSFRKGYHQVIITCKNLKIVTLFVIGAIFCKDAMALDKGITAKQFNIVTVTRQKIAKYDEPLLLNEIFVLFKNIDNILGGDCFPSEYIDCTFSRISDFYCKELTNRAIDAISDLHITQYHSSLYSKLIPEKEERQQIYQILKTSLDSPSALRFKAQIQNIFSKEKQKLISKITTPVIFNYEKSQPQKPTLLVFQESIFSQSYLLNDEYINFIIELCKKITSFHNVSIHINLLHQFYDNKCPAWITATEANSEEININSSKNTNTTIANYSLIISKGEVAYVYIKTEQDDTLKKEGADLLIKEIFKLKSGNLESHDLSSVKFESIIATRICADMNLLFEEQCRYDVSLNKLVNNGILIIQSNTFDLSNIKNAIIKRKKNNDKSYLNRLIIHCDPVNGASVFKITEEEKIMACPPINSEGWPQYSQEYKNVRIPSGIEIDVNNEDCTKKSENGKLFYINIWSFDREINNFCELNE